MNESCEKGINGIDWSDYFIFNRYLFALAYEEAHNMVLEFPKQKLVGTLR